MGSENSTLSKHTVSEIRGAHKAIGESSQSEKKEIKVTKEGLYEAVDGHN